MTAGKIMLPSNKTGVRRCHCFVLVLTIIVLLAPVAVLGKMSVHNSPHNLSSSGGRGQHGVSFAEEARVCAFCHVPHSAKGPEFLWSRDLSNSIYTPYVSSTLKSSPKPGLPTGASRLCLSCHDGTIALGSFVKSPIADMSTMPLDGDPTLNANLGTDLSDDHPISFKYDSALAALSELVDPVTLPPEIKLDRNEELQCTTCHDPHDNEFGNFLVVDNALPGSPLCVTCHNKAGWDNSTHNPLVSSVPSNGCLTCHYSHNAPAPRRLLKSGFEEENCYKSCHNGVDPNSTDVKSLFTGSLSRHPVDLMEPGVHDPEEILPANVYHVECVDCHNPHWVNNFQLPLSSPPAINGTLLGIRRDQSGDFATTEYEVCFRCHAGGNAGSFSGVNEQASNRLVADPDQRSRFDDANPSFHPVLADRQTLAGASLRLPLQLNMLRIYCTDCHNSDQSTKAGGSGANGPHGSSYEHILMARYDMPKFGDPLPAYSSFAYDLCFRCHEENYIMISGTAFVNNNNNEHARHVGYIGDRNIPCFVCHDPHGTSRAAGATTNNNAHLINLNLDYTLSFTVPNPQYLTLSAGSGSCTVSCHSNANHTRSYGP